MPTLTKRVIDAARPGERDVYLGRRAARLRREGHANGPQGLPRAVPAAGQRLTRRVTIGAHGSPWTVDMAQREARRLFAEVAAGRDPQAERQDRKGASPCARLPPGGWPNMSRPNARPALARIIDGCWICTPSLPWAADGSPRLPAPRLHGSTTACVRPPIRQLRAPCSHPCSPGPRSRVPPRRQQPLQACGGVPEKGRERFLSQRELARLGRALRVAERSGILTPWTVGAIRLLVFTGARLNEILTAKWDYWPRGQDDAPSGQQDRAKTIHLNPPAVKVLAELPRLEGNPWLIVGRRPAAIWSISRSPGAACARRRTHGRAPSRSAPQLCQRRRGRRAFTAADRRPARTQPAADHGTIRPPVGRSTEGGQRDGGQSSCSGDGRAGGPMWCPSSVLTEAKNRPGGLGHCLCGEHGHEEAQGRAVRDQPRSAGAHARPRVAPEERCGHADDAVEMIISVAGESPKAHAFIMRELPHSPLNRAEFERAGRGVGCLERVTEL